MQIDLLVLGSVTSSWLHFLVLLLIDTCDDKFQQYMLNEAFYDLTTVYLCWFFVMLHMVPSLQNSCYNIYLFLHYINSMYSSTLY